NSGGAKHQSRLYYWLAGRPWVNTICETGFNAGHSTLQWLTGNDHTKVYSFDLGSHKYARPMGEYFERTFPGRFNLSIGNSLTTVPRFSTKHPEVVCDIIVIDGGHSNKVALGDLRNMRAHANIEHNLLVLDDFPSHYLTFLTDIGSAWNTMRADGLVVERFACTEQTKRRRGYVIGYYV
ncbi:MAG: class I SAM-dependent methyltransferase, partial [Chromatiales bacterium]